MQDQGQSANPLKNRPALAGDAASGQGGGRRVELPKLSLNGLTLRAHWGESPEAARDLAAIAAMRHAAFPESLPHLSNRAEPAAAQVLIRDEDGSPRLSFRLSVFARDGLAASYAAGFYDLSPLHAPSGQVLELGRFCMAAGTTPSRAVEALRLAWAAIAAAAHAHRVEALMGCSSFFDARSAAHAPALALLAAGHIGPENVRPLPKAPERIALQAPATPLSVEARRAGLQAMPPLLRSYLTMGAWVSDHAVIDQSLNTLHVFTWLAVDKVPTARITALEAVLRAGQGAS